MQERGTPPYVHYTITRGKGSGDGDGDSDGDGGGDCDSIFKMNEIE
jgi:hypothetical protein